jgi:pyoverdine/dityrosine biosynthesis protein Dit1
MVKQILLENKSQNTPYQGYRTYMSKDQKTLSNIT